MTLAPPGGVQVGDLLVAYVAYDNASGSLSGPPAGWTVLDSHTGSDLGSWIASYVYQGEANFTWNFTGAPTNGVIIRAYRNASVGQHGPISSTTLNQISTNPITVGAGNWFLCFFGCYSTGAAVSSPPAGLSNAEVNANMASYDSGGADAGSDTATLTWSQNGGHAYGEGIEIV
ncbi:MAG TPA: hypothetical protein VF005_05350 [Acidimicrobiales bacterium]